MNYENVVTISLSLFTYPVSMIGWGIALIFMVLLLTPLWKYIWKAALVTNAVGWACSTYAGLTGDWFIGWFAWVIPLSGILFMRFLMEYLMNLPEPMNKEDNK